MKRPVAFVIPWFGEELKGGAEQLTWQVATRLAARGYPVEVLTTCCHAFLEDWETNHYREGRHEDHGVVVRRFRVDKRDRRAFGDVNTRMLAIPHGHLKPGVVPVTETEAKIFVNDNINSTALLNHLKRNQNSYQAVVFIPYLYGPILNGLSLIPHKAFLQPCLHDEVYAYLPPVAEIFYSAAGILYNSEGESHLASRLFGPSIIPKSIIVGSGIETGYQATAQLPACIGDLELDTTRFVLYLGRRDATKNVDFLIQAYHLFKRRYPQTILKLILAGPGECSYHAPESGIVDFGLVAETDKLALLKHCAALFQPSQNESFSRVMLESWFFERPVAAHKTCLSTAIAVETAQGGWLADTVEEWADLFAGVDRSEPDELNRLGSNGSGYAKDYGDWDSVIDRYEAVFGLQESVAVTKPGRKKKLMEIHQMTPGFDSGDAITNQTILLRNHLRRMGYRSDIYVLFMDLNMADEAEIFKPNYFNKKAGLIYHHSIGSDLTQHAIRHSSPKCLVYHNITPAEFVRPYDPAFAKLLEDGRTELPRLAQYFPLSVGDSAFNAAELYETGFQGVGVLPICVDPLKWSHAPDADLMASLQDGKSNLLFVGRISPNKCQDYLVETFYHYLTMDPNARLILVGKVLPGDTFFDKVAATIHRLGLSDCVLITDKVTESQLHAYYRTAHLYWSMSEHEGFGVPLIEAMWFDIPVLAYAVTAVPETMDAGGLLINSKQDLAKVAALAKLCVHDEDLRRKILIAQRKRRNDFLPDAVLPSLEDIAQKMEALL